MISACPCCREEEAVARVWSQDPADVAPHGVVVGWDGGRNQSCPHGDATYGPLLRCHYPQCSHRHAMPVIEVQLCTLLCFLGEFRTGCNSLFPECVMELAEEASRA